MHRCSPADTKMAATPSLSPDRQIKTAAICGARQVPDCRFVHYSSDVAGKAVSVIYGK